MALFKTIDDIKDYVNIPSTMEIDRLTPLMGPSAAKHIKPVIGKTLLSLLDEYYNEDPSTPDEGLDALLPKVQAALAHFILFDGIALLDVVVTGTGFGVVHTNNIAPASKERVAAYKQSVEDMAYEAIEELYEFLEENEADYAEWVASSEYSKHFELFINSAVVFEDFVIIRKSRRKYLDMVPDMVLIEQNEIIPKISEALATTIKEEIKDGSISTANAAMLKHIRGAVANLAFAAIMFDNEKIMERFNRNGLRYLGSMRRLLDENVDDYPDYKASDLYDEDRSTYDLYENKSTDPLFVM